MNSSFHRERIGTVAIVVELGQSLNVIEQDPDDNRVLEYVEGAGAHYIVSGNKHLLDLKEYKDMDILSPANYLQVLKLEEGRK